MATHFKYGGSTAARTMGCPAWLRLAETIPLVLDGNSNPAADTGTMLHNCMEELYSLDSPIETAEELLNKGREYKGQHLTQELVNDKLNPAIDAVDGIWKELDIDLAHSYVEPLVKIDTDIGGSIDLIGISKDKKTVLILDYKFGHVSVSAEDNKQLKFYALAAATDPATRELFDACDTIVMVIIQPNDDGEDLQMSEMSMDDLDTFETEYLAAVDLSDEPTAQPKGGSWCRYCPAEATCPVKTGAALKASRVNEITSDKLAEYLPLADEVIAWAKAVKKMAHEQLELATPIKGYKLVNKRATRVWNDQNAVEDKVRKAKKIKLADGFDYKLKSPAQLEKICKELGVDFKAYAPYISSVSTGTTLAKETDKRPAALPIAGLEQLNQMLNKT